MRTKTRGGRILNGTSKTEWRVEIAEGNGKNGKGSERIKE
jgi:hypothetical protein